MDLRQRLQSRFNEISKPLEMLSVTLSPGRFVNKTDFEEHLSEGAFINISKIGADALSVPCGKYMVWMTDSGTTVLAPARTVDNTVFPHVEDTVEVQTVSLLNNWDKLQRILSEGSDNDTNNDPSDDYDEEGSHSLFGAEEQPAFDDEGKFASKIHMSTVDREPLAIALRDHGITASELADQCGVDVSQISRILRKPKRGSGDPGGRNPSIGLASKVCSALRIRPEAAFPDLFRVDPDVKAKEQSGNRGSGAGLNKGAATKTYTQGSN